MKDTHIIVGHEEGIMNSKSRPKVLTIIHEIVEERVSVQIGITMSKWMGIIINALSCKSNLC